MAQNSDIQNAIKDVMQLFIHDDGSLPDIYLKNITPEKLQSIFLTAVSFSENRELEFEVWDSLEDETLFLTAKAISKGLLERRYNILRIPLGEVYCKGCEIPALTLANYSTDEIEFDYRQGDDWNDNAIEALFEYIALLKDICPTIEVTRAEEGLREHPDEIFTMAFNLYYSNTRSIT